MNWKEKLKSNWFVTVVLGIAAFIIFIGTVAGAINSLFDLAQRSEFTDEDSWLLRVYLQVSGWLSVALTLPVWLLLPISTLAVGAVYLLLRQRSQLIGLSQELDKLKKPAVVELDSTDERVLFWVRKIYDGSSTGLGPAPAIVAHLADMPLSSVEASVDVLKQAGLIRFKKLKSDPLDLTSQGREYFKPLEVRSRYDTFEVNLLRRRI